MPRTAFQIFLSVIMTHALPVWSLLNLLGRMVLSTNWSAPTIKPQMVRLKVQLKLLKVDWEGCLVEHWKQSFHGSYSPTGQHPIPQLELHQQNCWWKGSYRQIWTGWGHPYLSLYSSAKIIRNSIRTEQPRCRCFTKARRFLLRTLNLAPDGWPACFRGYWCPIFLDKITRWMSYLMSSRPHEGSPLFFWANVTYFRE